MNLIIPNYDYDRNPKLFPPNSSIKFMQVDALINLK